MNFTESWFADPIATAQNTFSSSFARGDRYYFLTEHGIDQRACLINYGNIELTGYRQEYPVMNAMKQRVSSLSTFLFVVLQMKRPLRRTTNERRSNNVLTKGLQ